jgi:hypothetical protein
VALKPKMIGLDCWGQLCKLLEEIEDDLGIPRRLIYVRADKNEPHYVVSLFSP